MTLSLVIIPIVTGAQTISPACRPLIDAAKKQITTPHHLYETTGTTTSEAISTGGVTYILVRGRWKRSPLGPKESLEQMQQNLASATAYSCQRVGDEAMGGVPTAVWTSHIENEGIKADARTWIATGTGLILKQEEDVQPDGTSGKTHMSMRWDYTNVQAPAGVAP